MTRSHSQEGLGGGAGLGVGGTCRRCFQRYLCGCVYFQDPGILLIACGNPPNQIIFISVWSAKEREQEFLIHCTSTGSRKSFRSNIFEFQACGARSPELSPIPKESFLSPLS